MSTTETKASANFIRHVITQDLKDNKNEGKSRYSFPP